MVLLYCRLQILHNCHWWIFYKQDALGVKPTFSRHWSRMIYVDTNHCGRGTGSLARCIRCSSWSSSLQTAEISASAPALHHRLSHACDLLRCCQSRLDNIHLLPMEATPSETMSCSKNTNYDIFLNVWSRNAYNLFVVVSTNCLARLICNMNCYLLSGMLNSPHSFASIQVSSSHFTGWLPIIISYCCHATSPCNM